MYFSDAESLAPYTLEERKFFASLQVFTPKEVMPVSGSGRISGRIDGEFNIQMPSWFILKDKLIYYLVNTGGYTYARYAGKLNEVT